MNQSKISVRYAKAVFELAKEKNALEKVYKDLRLIRETLGTLPEFKAIVSSPIVKNSDKISLFVNSFEGKVETITLDFVKFLVEKNREMYIIDILRNFESFYRKEKNMKEVVVTTVEPLNDLIRESIENRIKEVYQSNVEIKNVINEQLIGGVILRIENQQLDLSVKTQLNEIKQSLQKTVY